MNRSSLIAGLACGALLAAAGCGSGGTGGSSHSNSFTLALEQGNFDELPDWLALDHGFYKAQGLNVQGEQIRTGTTGIKALIGGKADLATAGGTGVVQADGSGGTVKFLASLLQTTPYVIAAKPNITSIQNLKGKTFAVSEFGSSSDGAARAALQKAGLTPEKDVQILQLGSNSQRLAGVTSGSAAATVLSPDQTGDLAKTGLHVVQNLAALNLYTVHLSVAATDSTLKKNPNLASKVRAAIGQAMEFIKNPANKQAVMATCAKYMKTSPTDASVVATYAYYQQTKNAQGVYPPQSKMLAIALQSDIDAAAKQDKSLAKLKPADLVADGSLIG